MNTAYCQKCGAALNSAGICPNPWRHQTWVDRNSDGGTFIGTTQQDADAKRDLALTRSQLAALRADLDAARQRLREYEGCPHCRTDHPPETMCAPHECRPGLTVMDRLVEGNQKYRRERDEARQQVAERDRIIEEQRQALCNLERTIDAIDVLTIPPDVAAEHTRQVGGPVSGYLTAYTEPTVIQHVKDAIAERDRQIQALRERGSRLANCLDETIPESPIGKRIQELLDEWDVLLDAPSPAPDDENRRLREALENPPYDDYYDALREGCDHEAAWGSFKEAYAEHARAILEANPPC